ncbi:cell division cycle protein 48 [Emiliania huxleyi CCMP1516]|uniref:Cell division cycle protein 48 n=2 Tax=Emiliania huxleyi TaxID=2903 RepID=A0A0D3JSH9_EMIH1|nr:cell division cycle protein 48 [Emiliania huxleyi CCMP1516]EOD26464.1 cell division cycle protein 48 [Emiliania huxleyi CCMP1516]|eukprot:XP_005778893.1 cell division cycle protein 48 [Emiliania huxleyi CCMP1516]
MREERRGTRLLPPLLLLAALVCAHARSAVVGSPPRRASRASAAVLLQRQRGLHLRGGQMAGERGAPPEDAASGYVMEVADERAEIADVERKRMPHELEVGDVAGDSAADSSECLVHPDKMAALNLMAGDTVRLKGRRSRETICLVRDDASVPADAVWVAAQARSNLHVNVGDRVKLYGCDSVGEGAKVTLQPLSDAMAGLSADELHDQVLAPHFAPEGDEAAPYRPVHEGDRIRVRHGAQVVEVLVVATEPERRCVVAPSTELEVLDEPLDRAELDAEEDEGGYDDIGGVDKQLTKIRELVELPMRHPKVFTSVGVMPPRGVLIHGPPGCGKTMIARAVAAETGAACYLINGPQVMSKQAGESEQNLRDAFEEAEKNAPAIIFIDEIDAIAPRRDKTQGETEKRLVSQLITLMDSLKPSSRVVLMAATNRPNTIDPALRRFGRFDLEINIPVPDEQGRLDILAIKSKDLRLSPEIDLPALAADTQGYCGADLSQVVFEAAMMCVRERMPEIDLEADTLPPALLEQLVVQPRHVEQALPALSVTNPSTLRESAIEVPNVSWKDIGGLEGVKRELRETVQYPVQYASKFEHFGMDPSKGVLFYGPPGCGKTLLAKAVANECKANFISVKGPELLTMWFGESEANVRELFDKARQASPCVIFFDEMDSIAKARGSGGGGASEAGDRVINQILTEIDGVGARKSVFVIGATNRPDILDPAIMRPGRLDQLIYIPMPDYESRLSILRATLRKAREPTSPLADDVDLEGLANSTEHFSGADLTEICQRACKLAIRHEIDEQQAAEAEAEAAGKPLPEVRSDGMLSAKHFAEAMKNARRSVSKAELARYNKFRKDQATDTKKKDAAPLAEAAAPAEPAAPEASDEEAEDLYD